MTSGDLQITDNLDIEGLGAESLTIKTDSSFPSYAGVFTIDNGNNSVIDVNISGLTITGGYNYAPDIGIGTGFGGGVFNAENLTITDSIIRDNFAQFDGGGVYSEGTATIIDSLITGNTASNGGGVSGNVDIIDSVITGNIATGAGGFRSGYGGGVAAIYGGDITISNSEISDNTGTGGVAAVFSGGVEVGESTVSGNTDFGVFVYLGSADIVESTISGNTDGIRIAYSSNANIANTTVSGNRGDGVVVAEFSDVNILNTTIANNTEDGFGNFSTFSGVVSVENTLIANNGNLDCNNTGSIAVNLNNFIGDGTCDPFLSGDPQLGILANNGGTTQTHALLPGSLAIDSGDNEAGANLLGDQRGVNRIIGSGIDIGAYEFQSTTPQAVPEPLTLLGAGTAIICGWFFKKSLRESRK